MTEAWVTCPNCKKPFPVGIIDTDGLLKIPYLNKLYPPGSDFICPNCHREFPVTGTEFTVKDPEDFSLVRRGIFRPITQEVETP